jgi:hypothetical protein
MTIYIEIDLALEHSLVCCDTNNVIHQIKRIYSIESWAIKTLAMARVAPESN